MNKITEFKDIFKKTNIDFTLEDNKYLITNNGIVYRHLGGNSYRNLNKDDILLFIEYGKSEIKDYKGQNEK